MESLDKLRWRIENGTLSSNTESQLYAIADEIESEIAEKYMLLPVDADGVPIKIGDCITSEGENRLHVTRLELRPYGWAVCCDGFSDYSPVNTHHVKPRTIEDVLQDFLVETAHFYPSECGEEITKYAAEIRELMGVVE